MRRDGWIGEGAEHDGNLRMKCVRMRIKRLKIAQVNICKSSRVMNHVDRAKELGYDILALSETPRNQEWKSELNGFVFAKDVRDQTRQPRAAVVNLNPNLSVVPVEITNDVVIVTVRHININIASVYIGHQPEEEAEAMGLSLTL